MPGEATESGQRQTLAGAPSLPNSPHASIDTFVSYASHDAPAANSVVATLEKHGLKCWIAPRDVIPGAHYADGIMSAINTARVFVLILSDNALISKHVGKEVERASSKGVPIVALRMDTAALTPAFEYFVSESQWIEVGAGGIDAAAVKLVAAVRRHLDSSGTADPRTQTIPTATRRNASNRPRIVTIAAVAAGAIALAWLLAHRFWLPREADSGSKPAAASNAERSIAVLPFTDLSEKKDQEYFADGVAESILDLLAKVPNLKVIARTSSFQFKGKSEDIRSIGAKLGVAYVLEGSIRRAGDRARVAAQLIDTRDGSHRWSETFDRNTGDMLQVQDDVALGLVRALQVTVGADELRSKPLSGNADARDKYLEGRRLFDQFTEDSWKRAAVAFQQALDLDPSFVRAAEWLAYSYQILGDFGYEAPPSKIFEQARSAAARALKLDPNSALAHITFGDINLVYDWDWVAAEKEFNLARRLEPRNGIVLTHLGKLSLVLGRWNEADRILAEEAGVDPLYMGAHQLAAYGYYATQRWGQAEAEIRKVLQISPQYTSAHLDLGLILLAQDKREEALAEITQELDESSRDLGLTIVNFRLGRNSESSAALDRLTKANATDWAASIAGAHAARGELDEAFKWLERAYVQKDADLIFIKSAPWYDPMRPDPRYNAFLRRIKLQE